MRSIEKLFETPSFLFLLVTSLGCTDLVAPASNALPIPHLEISCELATGWEVDQSVPIIDPAKGGLLMRLQPRDRISGSPRLEVRLDPLRVKAVSLEAFVKETLDSLKRVKGGGAAKTVQIQETQTQLMGLPAVRIDHHYTIGQEMTQFSVSQSSWFTMIGGRATVFSVSGRTELTTPRMGEIESVLNSLAPVTASKG